MYKDVIVISSSNEGGVLTAKWLEASKSRKESTYEIYEAKGDPRHGFDGLEKTKSKITMDREEFFGLVYDVLIEEDRIDFFEPRRMPFQTSISKDLFIEMKLNEPSYVFALGAAHDYFFNWISKYKLNTAKKYERLMTDFALFMFDYYFQERTEVKEKHISHYVNNIIDRNWTLKTSLDSISVLKKFFQAEMISFSESSFEKMKEKLQESLFIEEKIFTESELYSFKLYAVDKFERKENRLLYNILLAQNKLQRYDYKKREHREKILKLYSFDVPTKGLLVKQRRAYVLELLLTFQIDLFLTFEEMERLDLSDFKNSTLYLDKEKKNGIEINFMLSDRIEEYISFRKQFDYQIYKEKIINSIASERNFRVSCGDVFSWDSFLDKKEIKKISHLRKENEQKEKELLKLHSKLRELDEDDKDARAILLDSVSNAKHVIKSNESEIFVIVMNSETREIMTEDSYVFVDNFFISSQSRMLSHQTMRRELDKLPFLSEVEMDKLKEESEQFGQQKDAVSSYINKYEEGKDKADDELEEITELVKVEGEVFTSERIRKSAIHNLLHDEDVPLSVKKERLRKDIMYKI